MIYIASPYSHDDPAVRESRFDSACTYVAGLMSAGRHAFSPICHSHPVALMGVLPKGWDFWGRQDLAFLSMCDVMHVLKLEGWLESKGVHAEIKAAQALRIPVYFIDP